MKVEIKEDTKASLTGCFLLTLAIAALMLIVTATALTVQGAVSGSVVTFAVAAGLFMIAVLLIALIGGTLL